MHALSTTLPGFKRSGLLSFPRRRRLQEWWIALSRPVRLSGVTPGEIVSTPFRRVSVAAISSSSAHAKSDWLELSPPSLMNPAVISALARSLLAGELRLDDAYARAARTLGRKWRWLKPLVRRYLHWFAGCTRPRHRDVVQFLRGDPDFQQAIAKYRAEISIAEWIAEPQRMQPAAAARDWQLPAIESVSALADWLCLSIGELEWYADLKGLSSKTSNPKLQHYHYRILEKRSGGIRLLESPKSNLKALQRRILSGILNLIPAHHAVHGFVQGRSIATFAAPHVAKHILLRLDLQDFFRRSPPRASQRFFERWDIRKVSPRC